jgi:Mg2+ transporter MgtE
MLFLAHILNRPVLDAAGVRLGWVEDLVLTGLDLFPRIDAIVLARRGRGAVFIPWGVVETLDGTVQLSVARDALPTSPLDPDAIFLRRDILDKQVVDIHGRKVVRVNDLQLAPIDRDLRLIGADIGVGGLLRRLNLEGPVRALFGRRSLPQRVIPWNYVEGLATEWTSVRLNISHRRLHELPPTDIADIMAQLHPDDREELLQTIDDETLADTLPHLEEEVQAEMLIAMGDERAADLIEIMPPDEAADALGELTEEHAERILGLMEPEDAEDVRELLQYEEDTAGGLMTTEFIALAETLTAREALAALRALAPDAETVYYVYVTDADTRLRGVLSLRDLILAAPDSPIAEVMRDDVIRAHVNDDQETVAHLFTRYHLLAIPVIDDDDVLRGIITVDDVLDVLHEEAEEDVSRAAGVTEESTTLASPWEQTTRRIPWLLGAAAAGLVTAFLLVPHLPQPASLVSLLLLLPLVLLLGVQVGGQGAAAVQVALADGADLRDIIAGLLRRQWPVGALLSLLGAGVGAGIISLAPSPGHVLNIAIAVWAVLLLNMLVGSLLPLLLARLRWDPLLVSRPLLAVLALLVAVPLLVGVR